MYTSSSPHLGTACGHAHRSRSALASSIVPSIVQWMLKAVMLMAASGFSHKSTPLRNLLARSSRRATSFLGKFANILAAYLQIRSLELCSYYRCLPLDGSHPPDLIDGLLRPSSEFRARGLHPVRLGRVVTPYVPGTYRYRYVCASLRSSIAWEAVPAVPAAPYVLRAGHEPRVHR